MRGLFCQSLEFMLVAERVELEARVRIELTIEVLQTSALPLGYRALALKLAPVVEKIHLRPGGMRCWQIAVPPSGPSCEGKMPSPFGFAQSL
jgi:hypothetical protein